MRTISLTNGKTFKSEVGESLLDAAIRNNIAIPYSCRTGRCNSCKCRVVEGVSTAVHPEMGLSEEERTSGWILSCTRTADSNLTLDVEDLGDWAMPSVKTLPCRISSIEKLAPDVVKVVLRLPPSSEFIFYPGQYVDLIGVGGIRRSYSLACATAADKTLELHVRAVAGGLMSEYWFSHALVNDLLRVHGPLGTFFLRDVDQLDLKLLATGTGIAPIKAMLEGIRRLPVGNRPRSVVIYWGGRTEADLYLDLSTMMPENVYVPVLSRTDGEWRGKCGHVQDVLIGDRPDLSRTVVYACGSDVMIRSARELLIREGLPQRRFHSDAFVCSADS